MWVTFKSISDGEGGVEGDEGVRVRFSDRPSVFTAKEREKND